MKPLNALLGLLALVALASCATVPHSQVLRIGTSSTLPPVVFEQDGKLAGLEVAMAEVIGKRLKRQVKWEVMPFTDLIPALERGDIDVIMAGMSITDRRARRVLFTEPYLQAGQMLMFRRSDLGTLNSTGAAHQLGRAFAVQAGSTGEGFVLHEFPSARIFRFDSTPDMVAALDQKKVDYLVQDAPAIWYYSMQQDGGTTDRLAFYRYLTHEQLAWAVGREDGQLQQQLNSVLAEMKRDGTLNNLISTWMPVRTVLEDR